MTEPRDWFKVWAAKSLLSDDLNSLTEHQERIFWRLMMKASLEQDRWRIAESPGLITKCMTTPAKFATALEVFAKLDMVKREDDGRLFVVNGPKWNEETERPRKPSDKPEAVKERVTRHRNTARNADETPPVTPDETRYKGDTKRDETPPPLFKRREEKRREDHKTRAVAVDDAPAFQRAVLALERLGVKVSAFVADDVGVYLDSGSEPEWFEAACAIAAGNGKASWNYVKAILSGWGCEGPPNLKAVRNGAQPATETKPFNLDDYEREQAERDAAQAARWADKPLIPGGEK